MKGPLHEALGSTLGCGWSQPLLVGSTSSWASVGPKERCLPGRRNKGHSAKGGQGPLKTGKEEGAARNSGPDHAYTPGAEGALEEMGRTFLKAVLQDHSLI